MVKVQNSPGKAVCPCHEPRNGTVANHPSGPRGRVPAGLGAAWSAVDGFQFNLHRARKRAVLRLIYVGLPALTGCASYAELESLRAEVATLSAVAIRAEASVAQTQRQLAALKEASEARQNLPPPQTPLSANSPTGAGYKWGKLPQDVIAPTGTARAGPQ